MGDNCLHRNSYLCKLWVLVDHTLIYAQGHIVAKRKCILSGISSRTYPDHGGNCPFVLDTYRTTSTGCTQFGEPQAQRVTDIREQVQSRESELVNRPEGVAGTGRLHLEKGEQVTCEVVQGCRMEERLECGPTQASRPRTCGLTYSSQAPWEGELFN